MPFQIIGGVPVWGDPQDNAVEQILGCVDDATAAALMADHHLGYSVPIGGVVAYEDKLSPAGVGYDIACGNKAARLDAPAAEVKARIKPIMDDIWRTISFGVGRKNKEPVDHPLFDDDPAWDLPVARKLKKLAAEQLGTVGSGNHYVDIFEDEQSRIWLGVHFGSRGLGHRLATHFINAGERQRGRPPRDCAIVSRQATRRRQGACLAGCGLGAGPGLSRLYAAGRALCLRGAGLGLPAGVCATGRAHCGRDPQPPQFHLARGARGPLPLGYAQRGDPCLPRTERLRRRLDGGISPSSWKAWRAKRGGWLSIRPSTARAG